MLEAKSRWKIRQADRWKVERLARQIGITPLVARLLVNRGIDDERQALAFLSGEGVFHNPFLLKDMDAGVERIRKAIRNKERIVVYGDYDADGVTATVVMLKALKRLGASADYYIPNRLSEGYGPNKGAFRHLKEQGYQLMITVDNGIQGQEEARLAREMGLDLIITDHHEPGPVLPEAVAVIHPKRPDSTYPFTELAGVGVAWKVATALMGRPPEDLLPYVAIGTIADLVPLIDENRFLVKKGLELFRKTRDPGLLSLLEVAGIRPEDLEEEAIGFAIGPRINAPGRMDEANRAVELFLTDDSQCARALAEEMDLLNRERQALVNETESEAIALIERLGYSKDPVFVVGGEGWHPGIIGIVASRLLERYYRPVVVLSIDRTAGVAKGSARSIPKFDIFRNLQQCQDLLDAFGGHPMAAGLTLAPGRIDAFRERLNQLAFETLQEEDFLPTAEPDAVIRLEDLTVRTVEEMQRLAPFGAGNPKPTLLIRDVFFPHAKKVGADDKHLKVDICDGNLHLDGIGFYLGAIADQVTPLARVSLIGEPGINEWNGIRKLQMVIKDVSVDEWQLFDYRGNRQVLNWLEKIPDENRLLVFFQPDHLKEMNLERFADKAAVVSTPEEASQLDLSDKFVIFMDMPPTKAHIANLLTGRRIPRIYVHFYQKESQYLQTLPNRNHFKWFYAFLLKKGFFDMERYGKELAKHRGWTEQTIKFMTQVFLELDFITIDHGIVSLKKTNGKRDLAESATYRNRWEKAMLEKDLLYSPYTRLKQWFDRCFHIENLQKEEQNQWI